MNDNPHLKRLVTDYNKLRELEARSPYVRILNTMGDPPTVYEIFLSCKGISRLNNGRPEYSEAHRLKITLHPEYPRNAPRFEMLTDVWHPNVSASRTVCIGKYAPSMGLDDLVIRIIEIIRYENIGLDSPFNSSAAAWARSHNNLFPLDKRQIVLEDIQIGFLDEINILNDSDSLVDEIKIL